MPIIGKYGKIILSADEIQFIKDNWTTMTNPQLAEAVGMKLTKLRDHLREMGFKRMELEYWPPEAVKFLKYNYHKIGNVELVKIFTKKFPKKKGWSVNHIDKKLEQMNLKRSKLDWWAIKERNRNNGSFGNKNEKNVSAAPKAYFNLDSRTRIEIKPGQSLIEIKERYQNK